MRVSIHDSKIDEAQAIFDLRSDTRLAGMQYRPSIFETPLSLFAILSPGPQIPANGWMCSTILFDGEFAGHITQIYHTSAHDESTALIGWNVIPELWGKSIAPDAVGLLLQDRFSKNDNIEFCAFCFESNARCVRVLEKLGFENEQPRWSERFKNFCRTYGRHKLLKYRLGCSQWAGAKQQIIG